MKPRCSIICTVGLGLVCTPGCGRFGCEAPRPPAGPAAAVPFPEAGRDASSGTAAQTLSGTQLFSRYRAACHGEDGGGNGPAARFVYPKPRNFREGQFRLVTATNQVPSDEDLMRVEERGMPGSAMFPMATCLRPSGESWSHRCGSGFGWASRTACAGRQKSSASRSTSKNCRR